MNRIVCILVVAFMVAMTGCSADDRSNKADTVGIATDMQTDEVSPEAIDSRETHETAGSTSSATTADEAVAPAVPAADSGMSGNSTTEEQAALIEEFVNLEGLSTEELIGLIKNGNERESLSAQEKLSLHGTPDVEIIARAYIDVCKIEMNKEIGEDAEAKKLMEKLGNPKNDLDEIRSSIGGVLSRLGEPSVQPLLKAINDGEVSVSLSDVTSIIQNIGKPAVETLIASLEPDQYEASMCIIEALGYIGDPRAIEPLISIAKGEKGWDEYQGETAMYSLATIGEPAVEPLIEVLQSEKHYANETVQADAAETLGIIEDTRAVDPLVKMLESKSTDLRMAAARGLCNLKDIKAVTALECAMSDNRLDIIAGACMYFIRKGEPSSEDILVKALNKYGDSDTAVDFLNSGNERLEEAGRKWADDNGYFITTLPGFGGSGTWGSE